MSFTHGEIRHCYRHKTFDHGYNNTPGISHFTATPLATTYCYWVPNIDSNTFGLFNIAMGYSSLQKIIVEMKYAIGQKHLSKYDWFHISHMTAALNRMLTKLTYCHWRSALFQISAFILRLDQ